MSLTVRPLADEDLPAAWELGRLAFGGPATAPDRALRPVDGLLRLGAFASGPPAQLLDYF